MKASPRKPTPRTQKIGLLLSENSGYGLGVLRGIANFAKDQPHLRFRVLPPNKAGIALMGKWEPDGLIVALNKKSLAPRLVSLGKPIVYVCKPHDLKNPVCVQSDDAAVGRLGAAHLLEINALNYGFVGFAEGPWVQTRGDSFIEALKLADKAADSLIQTGNKPGKKDLEELRRWLRASPKPLAVLACNDHSGRLVLETAKELGLKIPDDVAVLGVNNEDPLSRLVWPGLSSINLATDEIGRKALTQLQRLLSGLPPQKATLFVAPLGVVTRGSTRQLALEDPLLAKVLSAIHEAVGNPPSVADLVKLVPLSRISLERRFRRFLDRTPLEEIRRVRNAQARQLLVATDLPLKAVASQCGYPNASRLIEAFRRETGMTPKRFREGLKAATQRPALLQKRNKT